MIEESLHILTAFCVLIFMSLKRLALFHPIGYVSSNNFIGISGRDLRFLKSGFPQVIPSEIPINTGVKKSQSRTGYVRWLSGVDKSGFLSTN